MKESWKDKVEGNFDIGFKMSDDEDQSWRRLTSKQVGEHLMQAGRARLAGRKYDFPGGARFPRNLFQ